MNDEIAKQLKRIADLEQARADRWKFDVPGIVLVPLVLVLLLIFVIL